MSLSSAAFMQGATWNSTGGTSQSLSDSGRVITNGRELVFTGDTSLLTRRSIEFKATLPLLPVNQNAYARLARTKLVYRMPFIAADGKLYQQAILIETAFHAEDTNRNSRISDIPALVADTDFSAFWQNLVLS